MKRVLEAAVVELCVEEALYEGGGTRIKKKNL